MFSRRQLGDPIGKCIRRCRNGVQLTEVQKKGGEEDLITRYIRGNRKVWNRCRVPVGYGVVELS